MADVVVVISETIVRPESYEDGSVMKRAKDFNIVLDDVAITHLSYGVEFSRAVEQKQVAQQEAERSKFVVMKADQERRAAVIRAEGESEAAQLISDATAKAGMALIELRRIEASREIAATLARSPNRATKMCDKLTDVKKASSHSHHLRKVKSERSVGEDRALWRLTNGKFKQTFSTSETWNQIREAYHRNDWHKGIWFHNATPKFSFIAWLAMHNRLTTGDRMRQWNAGVSGECILCTHHLETRNHLFFTCQYSNYVWKSLAQVLLRQHFTSDWDSITTLISKKTFTFIEDYLIRYVFQATISAIWKERNGRRHGDPYSTTGALVKFIDKTVRNIINSIRRTDSRYEDGLTAWFTAMGT